MISVLEYYVVPVDIMIVPLPKLEYYVLILRHANMATLSVSEALRQAGRPPSREDWDYENTDEIDETLVGPVYLRLDDPSFRSYVQYANTTYEQEEEVVDEEIGLDLSAPPPES